MLLLYLGVWQMKRLAWKEALLENISYNLSSEPSILPTELKKSEHNYKMVEVKGFLEPRAIFILTPVKDLEQVLGLFPPWNYKMEVKF